MAAERSHPKWRSLSQRPHERAEDHGQALCPDAAGYPSPGSQVRVIERATGGRRQLRADTRSEAPRLAPAGSRAGSGILSRSSRLVVVALAFVGLAVSLFLVTVLFLD